MKEQDQHEKQSMSELPHIDDAEYARMIEMSETLWMRRCKNGGS